MRVQRPLLGLTRWDRQRNPDIRNTLEVKNLIKNIKLYQRSWLTTWKEWIEAASPN
jgi:hypothetical protein